MPPQKHTTDRFNMAERVQVGALLCFIAVDVFRILDVNRHPFDHQRIEEVT